MRKLQLIIVLMLFFNLSYSQINTKDNPAVNNNSNQQFINPNTMKDFASNINNADYIEAYLFEVNDKDKTTKDSLRGLQGFKIKRRIPRVLGENVQKIKNLLTDTTKLSAYVPSCGDNPGLAFKFVKGNKSVVVSVNVRKAMNSELYCAVARYYFDGKSKYGRDISKIRTQLAEVAKELFPRDWPPVFAPPANPTPPAPPTVAPEPTPGDTVNIEGNLYYVAKKGDKLKNIYQKYKVPKKQFFNLNKDIKKNKDVNWWGEISKEGLKVRIK